MADEQANATVVFRRDVHNALWIIRIKPDAGVPDFIPGQYAELALPELRVVGSSKLVRRAYSIASAPGEKEYLEFFVALVEEGEFTPKLHKLGEGDRLWVNPRVKGKFTLDEIPPQSALVMVATGTGIAPFVSMMKEYANTGRWTKCAVLTGVRLSSDLAYEEELARLRERDQTIQHCASVTREPDESSWKGKRGRVNQLLRPEAFQELFGWELNPSNTHFLLCGNPAMIDEVIVDLEKLGFSPHSKKDPGQIHFERYW